MRCATTLAAKKSLAINGHNFMRAPSALVGTPETNILTKTDIVERVSDEVGDLKTKSMNQNKYTKAMNLHETYTYHEEVV